MMLHGYPISAKFSEDLGFGERFWYWEGGSGNAYIHSVYAAGCCPHVPGAVYVLVNHRGGLRDVIGIGRFGDRPLTDVPPGVNEIHIHLLARDKIRARMVLADLGDGRGGIDMPGNEDAAAYALMDA